MPDNFDQDSVMSGTWEGYYEYDDQARLTQHFPISADLLQSGKRIHGIMTDGITHSEVSLKAFIKANEGRMSQEALRRIQHILMQAPDLKYESLLPKESQLEGKITGLAVQFTKTYMGTHTSAWVDGSRRTQVRVVENHQVVYRGVLALEGATIEGRWFIYRRGFLGRILPPQNSGRFQLFKKM